MDFIRTARAKGLTRRAALWRHAVPNALPPVVTILGPAVHLPDRGLGAGRERLRAAGPRPARLPGFTQRDLVVVQDVVLFFAALVIVVNFLVDLAYLALDPRLRDTA